MKKGIISKVIVGIFTFNLIFTTNGQATKADTKSVTPIISSSRATLTQMEDWAEKNNATDIFISLAKVYWNMAPSHGQVDPVLAYAQSALETNFGKFTGLLNEDYKNPCGMKQSGGGADDDKDAHYKFSSWEDGVSAHLDHLALYAGAKGYPKAKDQTKDPRHFESIYNTAKNAEDLSGKWATSQTYGDDIVRLINGIKSTPYRLPHEYNMDVIKYDRNTLNVSGWILMQGVVTSLDVKLNNELIGQAAIGGIREDVYAAYPKYNIKNSGFSFTYPMNKVKEGSNTLTFIAKDGQGKTFTINNSLNVSKLPFRQNVELIDISKETLKIGGWTVMQDGVKEIKVSMGGTYLGSASLKGFRPDVDKVYPGYMDGKNSGFNFSKDVSNFAPGEYTVTLDAIGNDGTVKSTSHKVNLTKPKPLICVDSITYSNMELKVKGWALNASGVKQMNVYVDDKKIGEAILNLPRQDVANVYPEYKDAANSGYDVNVSIKDVSSGKHNVTLETIGNDGSKTKVNFSVEIAKKDTKAYIDAVEINNNDLVVRGWALSPEGVKSVDIYSNKKLLASTKADQPRIDVDAAYPGYVGGKTSGYGLRYNLKNLPYGKNTIEVVVNGVDGSTITETEVFNFAKQEDLSCLDAISLTWDGNLALRGWALSQKGITKGQIYVNNELQGEVNLGGSRPDVDKVYPGYYDGNKSGFSFEKSNVIVKANIADVKIVFTTYDGQTITSSRRIDITKEPTLIALDSPTNGSIVDEDKPLTITGWALSAEGNKNINVYVDGKFVKSSDFNVVRTDVNKVYPKYKNSSVAGYNIQLDISSLTSGKHDIKLEVVSKYDIKTSIIFTIQKGRMKTIVLDPGHNFKGTDGSYGTVNGVSYSERNLNWQLTEKLKTALEGKGYIVKLTTTPNGQVSSFANEDLRKIVEMANSAGADLFISMHHDYSDSSSTSGVSTHYSTYRPNIETSGVITGNDPNGWYPDVSIDTTPCKEAILSKQLADDIVNSISREMGYRNLKSHDHNLYVTRNTTMPSVLIEAGFVTSSSDTGRIGNEMDQLKKTGLIATAIDNFLMSMN